MISDTWFCFAGFVGFFCCLLFCCAFFFLLFSPSKTLLLVREGLVKIIGSSYMSKFFFFSWDFEFWVFLNLEIF